MMKPKSAPYAAVMALAAITSTGLPRFSSGQDVDNLRPLTARAAEAIARGEAEAEEDRHRRRVRELAAAPAASQRVIQAGDRRVIINRLLRAPEKPEAGLADGRARQGWGGGRGAAEGRPRPHRNAPAAPEERDQVSVFLTATVHRGGITELRWSHGGRRYLAYSRVDFNLLRGVGELEDDHTIYTVALALADAAQGGRRGPARRGPEETAWLPAPEAFSEGGASYLVVAGEGEGDAVFADAGAFVAIDALHLYYHGNEHRLKARHRRARALEVAREKIRRENPPSRPDTVINFAPHPGSKSLRRGGRDR